MAKLKYYEIRPRGRHMMNGKMIQAVNAKEAMLKNGNKIGSMVIDPNGRDWWIVPTINHWVNIVVVAGKETIHPYDLSHKSRLALAKACEIECQRHDKIPTMEYSNFENQTVLYAKEYDKDEKIRAENWAELIRNDKVKSEKLEQLEKKVINKTTECMKECTLAEIATIAGEPAKASAAMSLAESLCKEIKIYAEETHLIWATEPNTAEKAAYNAQIQFDKTSQKIKKFKTETITVNQAEGLDTT